METLTTELDEYKRRSEQAAAELTEAQEELAATEATVAQLRRYVDDMSAEAETTRVRWDQNAAESRVTVERLVAEADGARADAAAQRSAAERATAEAEGVRTDAAAQRTEAERLAMAVAELKNRCSADREAATARENELLADNARLAAELRERSTVERTLNDRMAAAQETTRRAVDTAKELKAELNRLETTHPESRGSTVTAVNAVTAVTAAATKWLRRRGDNDDEISDADDCSYLLRLSEKRARPCSKSTFGDDDDESSLRPQPSESTDISET